MHAPQWLMPQIVEQHLSSGREKSKKKGVIMMRSKQTTMNFGEDGCQYRTILEQSCKVGSKGEECQKYKQVFRKCPQDREEKLIEGDQEIPKFSFDDDDEKSLLAKDPYLGVSRDV